MNKHQCKTLYVSVHILEYNEILVRGQLPSPEMHRREKLQDRYKIYAQQGTWHKKDREECCSDQPRNKESQNVKSPGSVARSQTSFTDSISRSCGACKTIVVEPTTHKTQPRIPKICSLSRKMMCASTALQTHKNQ